MRPRFRETLEQYGAIAKDMKSAENSALSALGTVLNWHIGKEAEVSATSPEAQFSIFETQQKKQAIMDWLKSELRKLDEPEAKYEQPKGSILISQAEDGHFYRLRNTEAQKQERSYLTLGELLTDGDWGLNYFLDPATMPRMVRKQFLVEEAKRRLQAYLDDQIITAEVSSTHTDSGRADAYKALRAERKSGEEAGGHALEKMVRNFFRKLHIDHNLPVDIEHTDVFQDVEQKIDFIFRRPRRLRGIGVMEKEGAQDIAIQFTKNTDPGVLERKMRQIRSAKLRLNEEDDVADIRLVVMSTSAGGGTVRGWKKEGMPSGGPDKLWDSALREQVFRELLGGFLPPEELDQEWRRISAAL